MKKILISLVLFLVCGAQYVSVSGAYFTAQGSVDTNTAQASCWEKPGSPVPTSPSNGFVSNITTQTLTWNPGATSCPIAEFLYTYEIYTDAGLTALYQSGTTTLTSLILTGLPDNTYYWRISGTDQFINESAFSTPFSFSIDTKAPTVSIGNGNDGTTRYNSSTLPQPIVNSPTNTGGPTHDSHVSGTVPLYATTYDPHMMRYHFRIIRDGETESGKDWSAGNGYFFGGYIFTAVVNANLGTNTPVINLDTTKLTDGVYWLIIGARDTLGHRNATNADQDPRIKIIVDNTKPTATLSVTGSPTKIVEENVENGSFESGTDGWTTTNDVLTKSSETISGSTISPTDQSQMIRIGDTSGTAGNYTWVNRLMQSIPAGARTLSFMYNFYTRDYLYDDPGMFVRINGTDAFHMSSWMINPSAASLATTGWQRFVYDISYITDPFINLTISAGNTEDKTKQSWVYVDQVTTYYVAAPSHASYELTGNESGATYHYRTSSSGSFTPYATPFSIPVSGEYILEYYAQDLAGNTSPIYKTTIITDATAPSPASDMAVIDKSANSLTLTWTAPGDDGMTGRASRYDLRYSLNTINESTFDQATAAATISSPTISGEKETMRIEGLNPDTTYFVGLKVYDDAGNSSTLITVSEKTDIGDPANPGDVIINEMIWKGTSVSIYDEWIELRNKTDRVIDISGWQLTKYLTDTTDTVMYTFPATSYIQPHGYIVVAEYDEANSALIKEPDFVNGSGSSNDGNFGLSDTHLRIQLLDGSGTLIDIAWDGSAAPTMYHQPGYNYSMERMENPGNGYEKIRWYPCIDEASRTEFFDGTGIDYGTPGAANRSENEPLIYDFLKTATASAAIQEPALTLTHDEKLHTASFTVVNIQEYTTLSWELSYDTDQEQQGVIGKTELAGEAEYTKTAIPLGTYSTGDFVYHTGVKNLKLTVTLKTADEKEVVLENIL